MSNASVQCCFCGELTAVALDETDGIQTVISDCEVCCRPLTLTAEIAGENILWIEVSAE
ncbi:MAG: CPXCG motif-containing cysteine-rich protein [Limisphaerales bacterium]